MDISDHKLQKQRVSDRQPKQEQVPDLGGKFQKVPTLPTTRATTRKSSKKKGISNVKHERNTASYQISRVEKLSTEPGIYQDLNTDPDEKMETLEDEDYLEILPIDQTELVSGSIMLCKNPSGKHAHAIYRKIFGGKNVNFL